MTSYSKTWVVDIETLPPEDVVQRMDGLSVDGRLKDENKIMEARRKKIALDPALGGRIAMVGLYDGEQEVSLMLDKDLSEESEKQMLSKYFQLVDGCGIVTYNGKKFDLPYLAIRGAILGVCSGFANKKAELKHRNGEYIDIMEMLQMFYGQMKSLDNVSNAILNERKVDFDVTSTRDKLKTDAGRAELERYCLSDENSDCKLTYKIAKKLGVL